MDMLAGFERRGAQRGVIAVRGRDQNRIDLVVFQHRRLVRDDVAEGVLADDHVVVLRVAYDLHRQVVGIDVLQLHVRVVRRHLHRDLPPKAGRLQHVGLVHRGEPLAPSAGQLEAHAEDAHDLLLGVAQRIDPSATPRRAPAAFGLREVEPAGELSDHDHVHALKQRRLDGAGVDKRRVDLHRPQVRVEAQFLAQG